MNSDIFKKLSDEYSNISSPVSESISEEPTKENNDEIFQEDENLQDEESNNIVFDIVNLLKHWSDAADKDKVMTEWLAGERIRKALYGIKDLETGQKVLNGLAEQCSLKLGPEFELSFIELCLRLSEVFPDMSILTEATEVLSREQVVLISKLENDQERLYYSELCKLKKWTLEQLQSYIEMGLDETQKTLEE